MVVDQGACRALEESKKSLLAGGVLKCSGSFKIGDVVDLTDEKGQIFARGLINYSRDEVNKIKGCKTLRDAYVAYKENLKSQGTEYVDYKTYSKLIKECNKSISDYILDTGDSFKLPFIGSLVLRKRVV
mgnify:CR=1 FL=1